jgi:DNA-directed RNA polymerase subunit RPC12/RpoP
MRAFLLAALGSLVAAVLGRWIAQFAVGPTRPYDGEDPAPFARSRLVRLASGAAVATWFLLGSFLPLVLALQWLYPHGQNLFWGWFAALISVAVVHGVAATLLKCPRCGHRFLVQWTKANPAYSKSIWGLGGWAATALDVVLHDEFTCMYCGQHYLLRSSIEEGGPN